MVKPLDEKAIEPYMSAPTGNGYLGTLLYDDIEDKIQCHECGDWFRSLNNHINFAHKTNAREYKERFGLNYSTALQIPSISEHRSIQSEFMFRLNRGSLTPEQIHAEAVKRGKKGGRAMKKKLKKGFRHTVEMMNRFGTCPAQVEERFIRIIEEIGHTPSWDELYKIDAGLLATLYKQFKGYSGALEYFGLKGKRRVTFREYGKKNVELTLIKFVMDNKRLPNPKDTKVGVLPDYTTISKYFNGWMESKKFCYKILKKNFPNEAKVYEKKTLRRIAISPPGHKRLFPVGDQEEFSYE